VKINELAKRLGLTPRAIRLYEQKGLLKPQRNADNGYRDYSDQDAWRLQTVASLRELGLGLQQIVGLLDKLDRDDRAEVHHYLELQRMAFTAKWVELKYAISCLDELITRTENKGSLALEDLFQLSGEVKRLQSAHASWKDRWHFDQLAVRFDEAAAQVATGSAATSEEYESALELIAEWVSPQREEKGLDIGTGTGNLAGKLLQRGADMAAVDQSKEMLSLCRRKHPQVACKLGNALSLPFLDRQFHFAVSAFALQHLEEEQQLLALAEMDRVLRSNGRICLAGPMYLTEAEKAASSPDKYPSSRSRLTEWLQQHHYVTIAHRISEGLHAVYGVRKH
jgi:putative AdoMet-dependent methyltransferase